MTCECIDALAKIAALQDQLVAMGRAERLARALLLETEAERLKLEVRLEMAERQAPGGDLDAARERIVILEAMVEHLVGQIRSGAEVSA